MRPFNVGSKIAVANAFYQLLHDGNADASFFVFPNQHVGAYKVQWPQRIIRNVIAAEGAAQFGDENLSSENHPILGRTLQSLKVNGADVPLELLQPSTQAELGREGFLAGRKMLEDFFIQTLSEYLIPETHGRDDLPPIAIDPGLREVIETAIRDIRAQQPH